MQEYFRRKLVVLARYMWCLMMLPYEGMFREAFNLDKVHTSFSEVTARASTRRASSLAGGLSVFNTCLFLRLLLHTGSNGEKRGVCTNILGVVGLANWRFRVC
jgi:hypothetical protein